MFYAILDGTTPKVPHQYEAVCLKHFYYILLKTRRKGFEFEVKEHSLNHALGLKVRNLSLYLHETCKCKLLQAELPAHKQKGIKLYLKT